MKFFGLLLSLTTFSAIGQTTYKEVFGDAYPEHVLKLLFHKVKAEKPSMTLGEQLVEKRKIEEYIGYVRSKRGDTKVPTYEEFKKDPDKYYDEDRKSFFSMVANNPSDSLEYCKKTALQVVVCPEGSYTFTGSKSGIEVSDSSRGSVKEGQDKNSAPSKNASASDQ